MSNTTPATAEDRLHAMIAEQDTVLAEYAASHPTSITTADGVTISVGDVVTGRGIANRRRDRFEVLSLAIVDGGPAPLVLVTGGLLYRNPAYEGSYRGRIIAELSTIQADA